MPNAEDESALSCTADRKWTVRDWPRLWFGISDPVGRTAYAASGVGLMVLKYAVEVVLVWSAGHVVYWPWDFVNPVLTMRLPTLQTLPPWLAWGLFLWTLPFLWIAISMSVRRAADAGASPWWGMAVLMPVLNLFIMVILAMLPRVPGDHWTITRREPSREAQSKGAVLAIAASLVVGGVMMWISVYVLATYGNALFLGTPLVMGSTAAYLYNRPDPRSWSTSLAVGTGAVFFAAFALLLFALEGVVCVVMALPLLLPIGLMGGAIGKAIAEATRPGPLQLTGVILALPLLAGGEKLLIQAEPRVVLSSVEIEATPETVWEHVVAFPDLPAERDWYFRAGIACPLRARIVGQGVGATRYCEFTTGAFVEPITVWNPPHRLAFDVTEQPAPMFELSPFADVHPPHLDHHLRSYRGEFRLTVLGPGRTRLEGRTWYTVAMFPQSYWTLWSDLLIHRIHLRVLSHIKHLCEPSQEAAQSTPA